MMLSSLRRTFQRTMPVFCTTISKQVVRSVAMTQRRNFFLVVDQATVAYRQFLGMNRVRLEPGVRLNLPIIHDIRKVDMREVRIDMAEMSAVTKDNIMVWVSGTLFFKVKDAERACFSVSDYVGSVDRVGHSAIRSVIGGQEYDTINNSRNTINALLVDTIGTTIDQWGVECTRFEIQSIVPQSKEVIKQLEIQMEAERMKRKNVLDTESIIKTAEGAKTSVILASEGQLSAQKNQAAGDLFMAKYRADAQAYAVEVETVALKSQVTAIIDAFGGDITAASAFLVEQQKLKHLATLAQSTTNSNTYFFPDGANLIPGAKIGGDLMKLSSK